MHQRLEKYLMGTRFAGIEVELRGDESIFHIVILKRTGYKLSIEEVFDEIKSSEDLWKINLKDIPVSVVVTGRGILYRQVHVDSDTSTEQLLRKILPNVSPNDFLISVVKNDSSHFVSVARKSVVLPVYNELKKHYSVIALNVGVQCIAEIKSVLPGDELLRCGRHVVTFDTGGIKSVDSTPEESTDRTNVFTIGDQNIAAHALVAFSAGCSLAVGKLTSLERDSHEEYIQRKLFTTVLRTVIIFIFAILTVNYFAFSHYWNLQQELEAQVATGGTTVAEVNLLQEQFQTRSSFLQKAGLLNNSSFAWYADQLAHNMPEGIRLSQMNFSPRVKLAEEDTIGFRANAIEIYGNCEESIILNRWIQLLQAEQWISSASVRSYEQDKADATGKFTLDLHLH